MSRKVELYKTVMGLVDQKILTEEEADAVFEQYATSKLSLSEVIRKIIKNENNIIRRQIRPKSYFVIGNNHGINEYDNIQDAEKQITENVNNCEITSVFYGEQLTFTVNKVAEINL